MVNAMVDGPLVNTALVANRTGNQEPQSEDKMGFVGSVRPETVCSHGDAVATDRPEQLGKQNGLVGAVLDSEQTHHGGGVDQNEVDDGRPVYVALLEMVPDQTGNVRKHFPGQIQLLAIDITRRLQSWSRGG